MPRLSALAAAALLLFAAGALAPEAAAQQAARPKTVILGFDGMDHARTRQWIDEGLLPNFARVAESGHFGRLETSNPAESPVSWAVFNTGSNPGKTGVGGFVGRFFARNAEGQRMGTPLPRPMLGLPSDAPADGLVTFPVALRDGERFAMLAAVAGLVLVFALAKLLLRLGLLPALILGLLGGAGGWWMALRYVADLPADGKVPYEINPMQGTNFWKHLDGAGVSIMGIQVASTFPPDHEGPNTRLLSGLGVKDISGSPGSWFIFTDDPWASVDASTPAGGKIATLYFDQQGERVAVAELPGPVDWVTEARHESTIKALKAAQELPGNTEAEALAFENQLREANTAFSKWKRNKVLSVSFEVEPQREAGTVTFRLQGRSAEVKAGGWSEFLPAEFRFSERFAAHGLVRFHVIRCDAEEVRIFVPPINIDPARPPEWLPISAPPEFVSDIAAGVGRPFETLGWACMTNPLKDHSLTDFSPQAFLDDIAATTGAREAILSWGLDQAGGWDVYYQVFSTTDRVGHMLMRETDPQHPAHDPAYAAQIVTVYGRSFPLGDALKEEYREADRVLGSVLARMERGDLGANPLLLVVADHGFTSFRRQVSLNNLLHELGFLKTKDDKPLSDFPGKSGDLLNYVDWSRTQAYSIGIGNIFINLQGREPAGMVAPEDYDRVVEAIRAALLAVRDGPDGPLVLTSVSRRDQLYSGPWWREGRATQRKLDQEEVVEHDGFADLLAGFAPYYRVAWASTLGGVDDASITDNTNHWSGDHVSVDPQHVPGVFLVNRRLTAEGPAGLIDIGPTVLARYGLDPAATDMDGRVLPIENLTR